MEMKTPDTPGDATGRSTASAAPATATGMKPNGPAIAVTIATGIGVLVLGILTTLSEASEGVADFLKWSDRVGPLSGKTILAVVAFLVSWGGLHMALRDRELPWRPAVTALVVLVAIALVLTFPPFFQLFESE